MRVWIALSVLSLLGTMVGAQEDPSTYDVVVEGAKCMQSQVPYQTSAQLSCDYTVGRGVKFTIAGVGQPDASILVQRATGLDSDFYLKFGVLHGCVIIQRGFAKLHKSSRRLPGFDMAFVSPNTGRVYKSWQECGAQNRHTQQPAP